MPLYRVISVPEEITPKQRVGKSMFILEEITTKHGKQNKSIGEAGSTMYILGYPLGLAFSAGIGEL